MFCARTSVSCRRFVIKVCWFSAGLEHSLSTTTTIWLPWYPKAEISCESCKTIQTDVPKFRFTELGSNMANPLLNNIHYVYNMQKEYTIQFYKTINKLLCNLSFAGQYTFSSVITLFKNLVFWTYLSIFFVILTWNLVYIFSELCHFEICLGR